MASIRQTPNAIEIPVNVVGSSVFARYSKISNERTYNMFITDNGAPPNADNYEKFLVNFPGYRRVLNFINPSLNPPTVPTLPSNLPSGSGRGLFNSIRGNFALAVIDSTVFKISPSLGLTRLGTIQSTQGEVFMAENLNSQICIVDGTNAYIYNYNAGTSITRQTDGALSPAGPGLTAELVPGYVEFHNNQFLFGNASKTNNGSKWFAYRFNSVIPGAADAITQVTPSFLALETKADFALAVKRIPGAASNVMVFGKTVTEIWTKVGGTQNYIRNPSVNINYGCISISTIGEGGNYLAWLAINEDETPVIMVYDGASAYRISTDGIDYVLGKLKAPQTSTAILFQSDGHLFYLLTFYDKRDNYSLLYDFTTKMFFNLSDQYLNYHPARSMMYFNLKTYFISLNNAALYELSSDITVIDENLPRLSATDDYNPDLVYDLQKLRITSNTRQANSTRYRANSLTVTVEQGCDDEYTELDLIAAQGNWLITESAFDPPEDPIVTEQGQQILAEDATQSFQPNPAEALGELSFLPYIPRIDLSLSRDGGVTWGSIVGVNLMPLGHRQNILQWNSFGVANDLSFKFRIWTRNRTIINNGVLEAVL